jgi:tRNA pseudouridine13 synthase
MKLKQLPADFIVEEIPNFKISQNRDRYQVFLLEKQELDTFDAVRIISKELKIPLPKIGFAGLKDKHGITRQYISIPVEQHIENKDLRNIKLEFVGYNNKRIETGDLKGNKFTIIVRSIQKNETPGIYNRAETIPEMGVPNYFDSQRFGSVIHNEFIAKYLIQKNYEQAVKIFLTKYTKKERKKTKDDKREILTNWKNLESVNAKNKVFADVICEYVKTKSWLAAYKKISSNLREMFVNAYQSYLWNECVKEAFKKIVEKERLYNIDYNIGSLIFYKKIIDTEIKKIPPTFQTISPSIEFSSGFEEEIVKSVLSKEKISFEDLDIKEETGNFFKTREREVILKPEEFTISQLEIDEINEKENKNRYKITLSFILPKGSYATIITKRIFGH